MPFALFSWSRYTKGPLWQSDGPKFGMPPYTKLVKMDARTRIPFDFMYKVNASPLIVRRDTFLRLGMFHQAMSCPGQAGITFDFEYSIRMWKHGSKVRVRGGFSRVCALPNFRTSTVRGAVWVGLVAAWVRVKVRAKAKVRVRDRELIALDYQLLGLRLGSVLGLGPNPSPNPNPGLTLAPNLTLTLTQVGLYYSYFDDFPTSGERSGGTMSTPEAVTARLVTWRRNNLQVRVSVEFRRTTESSGE